MDFSNPDTLGTEESVLISEVSWFQGLKLYTNITFGTAKVSFLSRCPHFRESWLEGFRCMPSTLYAVQCSPCLCIFIESFISTTGDVGLRTADRSVWPFSQALYSSGKSHNKVVTVTVTNLHIIYAISKRWQSKLLMWAIQHDHLKSVEHGVNISWRSSSDKVCDYWLVLHAYTMYIYMYIACIYNVHVHVHVHVHAVRGPAQFITLGVAGAM